MSDGDVSLIRDEDVLRRMWQQTEDFSRKKEIRTHMYRLREERLRNLYADHQHHAKGVEGAGSHVSSLQDQSFQGLKSKEVRDAASPPKVFHGADLKELSNAGWNVESENKTSDDGHTRERSVQANIEGRYDVEGGTGQFAAVDQQKQAVTEYQDNHSSLKRNENSANSATQEQVVRKTDHGVEFSSTKSSSSTSKFHEESSMKHEVPYSNDDYDLSKNTNTTNQSQYVANTSSYEQSLRKKDLETGELILRKVEYPDDNTKVIVETWCQPDGRRVTSTRREFRVPVHSTKSEQHSQTRSESKSYSTTSQQQSDVKTHKTVRDENTNIVDSQRYADDYDFKRNEVNYLNQKNEREELQQSQTSETKRTDKKESSSSLKQKSFESQDKVDHKVIDNKNVDNYKTRSDHQTEYSNRRDNYSSTKRQIDQRFTNLVDEVDQRSNVTTENAKNMQDVIASQKECTSNQNHKYVTTEDNLNQNKIVDERNMAESEVKRHQENDRVIENVNRNENVHEVVEKVTKKDQYHDTDMAEKEVKRHKENDRVVENVNRNENVDEVVEKVTKKDQYQTTYQSDYTQKKISNDWSPSHQAWASTLRADTPSSTRPTARASSPGIKTSTSSPRSSVSPDKTYRKPSSHGGSPTKSDRSANTYTDKYSSTHSTSTVNETRYTSPDRKPPRSPARGGSSPDRKHPDHRPRPSQSPEKLPTTHSPSPERKYGQPISTDHSKNRSPSPLHSSASPDKRFPREDLNRKSPEKRPDSTHSSQRPDRKSDYNQPNRPFVSPDRKPGYMKPTESQTNRGSPAKHVPSLSPERKSHDKITSIEKQHYKFIDEETKMYSRTDKEHSKYSPSPDRYNYRKSPSPMRSTPDDDSDCRSESPIRPTLRKTARSPSPPKGPVTFTKDTKESILTDTNTSSYRITDESVKRHHSPRREESPINNVREESPSKYGTYDKKQRSSVEKHSQSVENYKYDSITHREEINKGTASTPAKPAKEKFSPSKPSNSRECSPPYYGTYDKKRSTEEDTYTKTTYDDSRHDSLTCHKKISKDKMTDTTYISKYPRSSVSPVKSPIRDTKYRHTTDFISTEKTSEESDIKSKCRPRQLVTPSTSPTRKPKVEDTAPSTGQSSPTTSVSGFVYYGSPKSHEIVTDLDDYSETYTTEEVTTFERPETLPVDKRLSPSKIPRRSPSPEKTTSLIEESPVRKSSLKKSSTDHSPVSPTEKPLSSFRISPDDENYEFPEHKVVKKDRPDKTLDAPVKPKPPFERRETYEERCRKILGMTEDSNSKTVKRTSSFKEPKTTDTNVNTFDKKNSDMTKTEVTDFITHEKIDTTIKTKRDKTPNLTKSPSRDSSPTKLQDIINRDISTPNKESSKIPKESTPTRNSLSPDRKPGYMKATSSTTSKMETITTGENTKQVLNTKSMRQSPDKDVKYIKLERSSVNPSRKPNYEDDRQEKLTGPSVSPDRKPNYIKSTHVTSKNESIDTESFEVDIKTEEHVREIPDKKTRYHSPSDKSPDRKNSKSRSSVSPDRKPNYMKPTAATSVNHEERLITNTDSTTTTVVKNDTNSNEIFIKSKPSRLPSPAKTPTNVIKEDICTFIESEREQVILDKVQKSLRKLSPDHELRSPSREKSPGKSTISLQDLDITNETVTLKDTVTGKDERTVSKTKPSRMPLRNAQSTKTPTTPTDKSQQSPTFKNVATNKSSSISPKKPVSQSERPPSPHVTKASGVKPRDSTPTQLKKTPSGSTLTTKVEKIATDSKKTTPVSKQNSFTKSQTTITKTTTPSPTRKADVIETKHAPQPKNNNKDTVTSKKEDSKFAHTASDVSVKHKKSSPQRVKSKPEIQVSDLTNTKISKPATTTNKTPQASTNLAPKPKSATALNTPVDEDDVLVDVEEAKSSRENSPDRICPTPVNYTDDIQTPRYPDEVKEPDDEFRKRTHHIIHETETIVDDIVEIGEEDELFVKKADVDRFTESDECLLSVTDKVSKFTNKIETVTKPKESTTQFKDVEMKEHSDFIDENLKSDECLLTVSEKVSKFAKGNKETRDSRSPSRRITDEYDVETVYQDDYTKLSVNDKANLFIETAENIKSTKTTQPQKLERPDFTDVDEDLKSDNCLLSVSDKVNKFVKTAEKFLNESSTVEDTKVKEEYEKFMKNIINEDRIESKTSTTGVHRESTTVVEEKSPSYVKDTKSSNSKIKDSPSSNLKQSERTPTVKITTLRSSEAVKKAKALFENIATTQQTTKVTKLTDIGVVRKSPKPEANGDICTPQAPDIDSETDSPQTPVTKERPSSDTLIRPHRNNQADAKTRASPTRLSTQSPEARRDKTPVRSSDSVKITTKSVLSRYPAAQNDTIKITNLDKPRTPDLLAKTSRPSEPKKTTLPDEEKPQEKVPGYLRSTKTSQLKEEKPMESVEETEIISTRRGSGKFGVELRRTSVEKSTLSSERRRSSTEHHQPCIEDIFDLGLLEQMLEKVIGYEQRRRIRAQIRIVKKKMETERTETSQTIKITKHTTITNNRSSERRPQTKSPERGPKRGVPQKTLSPERPRQSPLKHSLEQQTKPLMNGIAKETNNIHDKRQRPLSPEKHKPTQAPRQPSPEKKVRTTVQSPVTPKSNRFNEYASAYMKKVGLNDSDKKASDIKTKKSVTSDKDISRTRSEQNTKTDERHFEEKTETTTTSMSKSISERTSSKDTIEIIRLNGKRSVSPEMKRSPERYSPADRLAQRSPSPDFKRTKISDTRETVSSTVFEQEPPRVVKKETIIKTVVEERPVLETKKSTIKTPHDIENKIQPKQVQEEKPAWVMNRNLKKTSSDSRTYSSKKVESEKTKYRSVSPSKVISKPIDVITSSYGPGPLDADGRPLFGIKALRKGANYQVKGTVIRQEFHSRNGGEPEGSVSVTAYSTEPEDLEKLLKTPDERPSRLHGLAAITTTKKFGGNTGASYKDVCTKEERATLEQFTHSDRKVADSQIESVADRVTNTKKEMRTIDCVSLDTRRDQRVLEKSSPRSNVKSAKDRREERTTVRQSSVKNLTEKYIKSASGEKSQERSAYPKAGLILRTAAKRDSLSSDSSAHAGLTRSDSAHSLGSDGEVTTTTHRTADGATVTTSTTQRATDGATVTSTTTTTCSATRRGERSFLDSSSKVTGVQDILTRMKNADIVIQDGDSNEDSEARALLNKFLGATVLMAGMQGYVQDGHAGKLHVKESVTRSENKTTSSRIEDFDPDQCWDERILRKHLEESSDYEQRRRLRARIRTLMAEQEACASAVTEALGAAGAEAETGEEGSKQAREEEEVTVTSSVRRDSSEKTVSSSSTTTTKTSKVIESMTPGAPKKPVSPFAKFRQLEKQNSTGSPPNSAKTPQSPGSGAPYFKFTDPALQSSAATIKERLLQWCRDKTRDYENVKLENFSTSWADGLAFCALIHHFLPDAFDYSKLTPDKRRHNFTLAFKVADEKAGIYPLLDVDDMVAMRKPDWKCVFTYVQAIHRRFKDQP